MESLLRSAGGGGLTRGRERLEKQRREGVSEKGECKGDGTHVESPRARVFPPVMMMMEICIFTLSQSSWTCIGTALAALAKARGLLLGFPPALHVFVCQTSLLTFFLEVSFVLPFLASSLSTGTRHAPVMPSLLRWAVGEGSVAGK